MVGAYNTLELEAKHTINMGTRMPLKIHERGEGSVKPRRHGFVPKLGTEERMIDFLKRFVGGWGRGGVYCSVGRKR